MVEEVVRVVRDTVGFFSGAVVEDVASLAGGVRVRDIVVVEAELRGVVVVVVVVLGFAEGPKGTVISFCFLLQKLTTNVLSQLKRKQYI